MLVSYAGECIVSITNINNGVKEPTHGYPNCNISRILTFGGYVSVRESLFTQVLTWVNTILNHIDTRAFCLGIKVLAWDIDPNGIENKNTVKSP